MINLQKTSIDIQEKAVNNKYGINYLDILGLFYSLEKELTAPSRILTEHSIVYIMLEKLKKEGVSTVTYVDFSEQLGITSSARNSITSSLTKLQEKNLINHPDRKTFALIDQEKAKEFLLNVSDSVSKNCEELYNKNQDIAYNILNDLNAIRFAISGKSDFLSMSELLFYFNVMLSKFNRNINNNKSNLRLPIILYYYAIFPAVTQHELCMMFPFLLIPTFNKSVLYFKNNEELTNTYDYGLTGTGYILTEKGKENISNFIDKVNIALDEKQFYDRELFSEKCNHLNEILAQYYGDKFQEHKYELQKERKSWRNHKK